MKLPNNICKCCTKKYQINVIDNYKLCNECYLVFSIQRTIGRISIYTKEKPEFFTEFCDEFVNAKVCDHGKKLV
jgi:hypothetical protein